MLYKPSMQTEWHCLAVHKNTRKEYAGVEKQVTDFIISLSSFRGATALLVAAIATGCNSLVVAQARYCNSFQLTHMAREIVRTMLGRCQSIESAMAAKGKTINCYSAHKFASTVSFGMYISVSERRRSQPCGKNVDVPFRAVLPTEVEESARADSTHISTTKCPWINSHPYRGYKGCGQI